MKVCTKAKCIVRCKGIHRAKHKLAMVTHEYLPFLPHDNWLLEENTTEVLDILNEDLRTLLLDVAQFWQAVRHNTSLHQCLSSYLQYSR